MATVPPLQSTDPADESATTEPQVNQRSERLPLPAGPVGHLRHSWAAIKLLRTWRAEYQALDDRLRAAVVQRDQRLAELGEAGYAARESLDGEVAEFAKTLDDLAAELDAVDAALHDAQDAHATTENNRRHGRSEHEKNVADARDALRGPARVLHDLEAQEETYQRTSSRRAAQTEALKDQLANLDETAETAAEQERLRSRLDTLLADAQQAKTEYATLRTELKPARAAVEQHQADLEAALNAQREAILALDAAVEKAQATVRAQENARATQLARRKAVTIDLARAILQLSPLELPERPPAQAAVDAITTLRTERTQLDAERAAFDGGALRRTAWVCGGLVLLLLILWIAL